MGSRYIKITTEMIPIFMNDGTVDMQELDRVLALALEDKKIDDDERSVLTDFFDQADECRLEPAVRTKIKGFRIKHQI